MTKTNASIDHRALLHTVGHRLVRAVAAESSPYAAALFGVVYQRRRNWQHGEWQAALAELDASDATVAEFLNAEHQRAQT